MSSLNRQQKERLVVRLRRQGKTYREIAEEVRISFSQIKSILDKYGADDDVFEYHNNIVIGSKEEEDDNTNTAYLPISSKAYKLFSEGKTPLQVSIALNLRAPDVLILYKEYRSLKHTGLFTKMYEEVGDDMQYFLKLCTLAKAQNLTINQVINYLTTFSDYLPGVELQYQSLQNQTSELQSKKHQLETELYYLNTTIGKSFDMLKALQLKCEEADRQRNSLDIQKLRLQNFISEFKSNNNMFLKIERFVQEKVNIILRSNIKLLELSLISALRAFRNDPNVYRYLFHKLDQTATAELISMARPDINLPPYLKRANISLVRANNNNSTLNSYSQDDLQYHTQKQKSGDYCSACYGSDAEGISRTYFENVRKEIISNIGLDSFEGIYAASHYTHYYHQHQYL